MWTMEVGDAPEHEAAALKRRMKCSEYDFEGSTTHSKTVPFKVCLLFF